MSPSLSLLTVLGCACAGSFDSFLNVQITMVLVAQVSVCLAFALGSYAWRQHQGYDHFYLGLNEYTRWAPHASGVNCSAFSVRQLCPAPEFTLHSQ